MLREMVLVWYQGLMRRRAPISLIFTLLIAAGLPTGHASTSGGSSVLSVPISSDAMRRLLRGEKLSDFSVVLPKFGGRNVKSESVMLRPYDPFATGSQMYLDEEPVGSNAVGGPHRFARGHLVGDPASFAFLSLDPEGEASLLLEASGFARVYKIIDGEMQLLNQEPISGLEERNQHLCNGGITKESNPLTVLEAPSGERLVNALNAGQRTVVLDDSSTGWSDVYRIDVPSGQSIFGALNKGPGAAELHISRRPYPSADWESGVCAITSSGSTYAQPYFCSIENPVAGAYYVQAYKFDAEPITLTLDYSSGAAANQRFRAKIAVDTDQYFYGHFGSVNAARNYLAALFAYVSAIFERDINTELLIGDVFFYTSAGDPYQYPTTAEERLSEVGELWRAHRPESDRVLAAHFTHRSVVRNFTGIAYLDALSSKRWGYSVQSVLGEIPDSALPIAYDARIFAHELGHNFSSPHTHCYGGLLGNELPVDACWNQEEMCWSGTASLPGQMSLVGGSEGERNGTIMSYCNELTGGASNLAGSFGRFHEYGVAPSRVSQKMTTRIFQVSAADQTGIPTVTVSPPLGVEIASFEAGNEEITLSVNVRSDGGAPITEYGASCSDGINVYSGTSASPLVTVSGLINGATYTCTVTATNSMGSSSASPATDPITPEASAAGLPIWLLYQASQ